jgi:hypothetical protein
MQLITVTERGRGLLVCTGYPTIREWDADLIVIVVLDSHSILSRNEQVSIIETNEPEKGRIKL